MHDRPTAQELLDTVADLLEGDVLAATTGVLQHQVRVAGNLCRIVSRELALEPGAERRERELLAALLDGEAVGDALEGSRALDNRLASGDDPELEDRAWPAVFEIVRAKLAVAKPGHDDFDFANEGA